MAFSTRVKMGLNALLQPIGLEIGTTLSRRIEAERLSKLQHREHWKAHRYDQGLRLDDDQRWLELLEQLVGAYKADYKRLPVDSDGHGDEYYLQNGWYGSVDAEVLYSLMRHLNPRHVFEAGSGFSTRLMRRAVREGNLQTHITSIDPHPNTQVGPYADEYIQLPVEDVEISRIVGTLDADDILFIDSSHRVATGGDVPFLFLEVLPRLKTGVYIHIHDIFLPLDYPEKWAVEEYDWTEQYLVHAFLCYNRAFEIIWPARYMWEYQRERVRAVIPARPDSAAPSSLWLKKVM